TSRPLRNIARNPMDLTDDDFDAFHERSLRVLKHRLGVDPTLARRHRGGQTLLHVAASDGNRELCNVLIAAGANVNAVGVLNCTPLHWAAQTSLDCVRLLIDAGADVNHPGNGCPPLSCAVANQHPMVEEILQELVNAGAEIDFRDEDCGQTALFRALTIPNERAAFKLLDLGADPALQEIEGMSPVEFVESVYFESTARLVSSSRIDVLRNRFLDYLSRAVVNRRGPDGSEDWWANSV
ncbi:MAG: ankyrin repeat domain-containing protein, partial [Planctomycetaceae bacterium]|nr:ankyrin repeat domain-containing protein [Planctomycetaceae bacterium]